MSLYTHRQSEIMIGGRGGERERERDGNGCVYNVLVCS